MMIQAAQALDFQEMGDDEQIVAQICAGDESLFAQIYQRYHTRIFALAYGMTGKREQADDMVQEIFLRTYERLASFNGRSSFYTWFYRLAVNCCLNYCRRERRRLCDDIDGDETQNLFVIYSSDAEDHIARTMLQQQLQRQVRRALLSLKPEMRILVVMKDIEGLSYEEIANRLNYSTGTVASRLNRARKLLAQKLENLKGKI